MPILGRRFVTRLAGETPMKTIAALVAVVGTFLAAVVYYLVWSKS